MELDKWDLEVIRYTKTEQPTIDGVREIWARRCAMGINNVHFEYIVLRLTTIVLSIYPNELQSMMHDAQEAEQWKFGFAGPTGYWENWLRVLCSRLRLTEVSKIPGYKS